MSEKSQKQLVSKGRYIQVMGTKFSLLTIAAGIVIAGTLATVLTMNETFLAIVYPHKTRFTLMHCAWFAVGSLLLLAIGMAMHIRFNKIPSVERITPRNACFLPVTETLVRPSDRPPTDQQTELLRTAMHTQETPAEELLRAGQGSGQDV